MPLIAGIDIGNATTEVALASDDPQARAFVASGIVATTGMKGTRDNIAGPSPRWSRPWRKHRGR